jgi:hypothetical protein
LENIFYIISDKTKTSEYNGGIFKKLYMPKSVEIGEELWKKARKNDRRKKLKDIKASRLNMRTKVHMN